MDDARHISHHCVDSFIGPSLSSVGCLESVSSHFDSAPGPPRTCSFLASLVSNSESASGRFLDLMDGFLVPRMELPRFGETVL